MAPERFDKWVDLAYLRLNELDLAGFVKNQTAIDQFVKLAVSMFAKRQLLKANYKAPPEVA